MILVNDKFPFTPSIKLFPLIITKIEKIKNSPKSSILTPTQVKRNWNTLTVVNALPYNEFNITYPGKMEKKIIHLPYNSPRRDIEVAAKKIKNKPYVVYCANPKCQAAKSIITKLVNTGCNNVYYMQEGVDGWN